MPERYSRGGLNTAFGFLANALDPRSRTGEGDTGVGFPRSDAEDMSCGARFIPGEVTLARRAGKKVQFVSRCTPNCWYWQMPDGSRIYHWDPMVADAFERRGETKCGSCGNEHLGGGTVDATGKKVDR